MLLVGFLEPGSPGALRVHENEARLQSSSKPNQGKLVRSRPKARRAYERYYVLRTQRLLRRDVDPRLGITDPKRIAGVAEIGTSVVLGGSNRTRRRTAWATNGNNFHFPQSHSFSSSPPLPSRFFVLPSFALPSFYLPLVVLSTIFRPVGQKLRLSVPAHPLRLTSL